MAGTIKVIRAVQGEVEEGIVVGEYSWELKKGIRSRITRAKWRNGRGILQLIQSENNLLVLSPDYSRRYSSLETRYKRCSGVLLDRRNGYIE